MPMTLAVQWYILVGAWMPLIALMFLCVQGWAASSIFDKDAQYWHFSREKWNLAHVICGALGFVLMILPVPEVWWPAVGFPVGLLVMFASTVAYWIHHNKNVPEAQHFRISGEGLRQRMASRAATRHAKAASIVLADAKGSPQPVPGKDDALFQVHLAMEDLFTPAFVQRASTIELTPSKEGPYQVSQVVDGVRYRRDPVDAATANAIIDYVKVAAGMDVADKRRKQVGDLTAKMGVDGHAMRIRTAGSSAGQSMTLDVDLKERVDIKPDRLGLYPKQAEALAKAVEDQHGIVLVSTPAGGGRTTTLYSLLRRHDAFTANIRTLEFEHLVQLDGVGHSEFKPEEGTEFAIQLRSMLRRDPNIVMIADLPDARTAQEAAAPGMRGPLIYIGLRADSGLDAVLRWCKAVGDLPKAAAPMKAVIYGRLVRKLCENCRVPYQPDPNQLRKLGLPPEQVKQLFKASGKVIERNREEQCPNCGGLGYRGQVGVYEVMVFDDESRALVAKGDLNAVKTHMRRLKVMTLQEAALRKAIEGATSIEEVIRVTRPPAASGGSGSGADGEPQPSRPAPAEPVAT